MLFFKQRFILKKFLRDVFDPQHGDQVLIMVDEPATEADDNKEWKDRREMAYRWRQGFVDLGFSVSPLLKYIATGRHNVDLPAFGTQVGVEVPIEDVIVEHNIVLSFSEFSATAALTTLLKTHEHLRGASLPRVQSYMERTSLMADNKYMAYKTEVLRDLLNRTNGVRVNFSTSQEMYFDLRHRKAMVDNGRCHPDKVGLKLINLPSGEVCINPYEGEIEGKPSETIGIIPAYINGQMIQFFVQNNKIASVVGGGETAEELTAFFEADDARRNISEFGLGCNERARVIGNEIEDEKAGFHCAYGRSDFLGGSNGRSNFKTLENVIHRNLVFSKGSPIIARKIILTLDDQTSKTIVDKGQYLLFSGRKKFS